MITSEESIARLISHGEYERAIADLTQLAESTRDPSWYCKRSEVYFKIGDLQKAYQDANRALEQQPSAEACFWKGCALMKLEEFEKASECFTQGKKLLGSNDKEILDKLQQGNICSALLRNASRSLGSFAEFESEFECTLCLELFYNPSTLPCGHTFCQHCLETATTFTNKCPLCRTIFHFHDSKPPVTITLKNIIEKLFKEEYAARAAQIGQKTRRTFRIPLLVMNVVCFPGEQLPLHIYETKYRTMFKRILQGCRHFGLVLDAPNNGIANVGCSLVIEQCEGLPDGRLIVQCTALKRFRIISREMIDGYWYAEIEYLQDVLPLTEDALSEMHALIDTVRDMAAKALTKNNLAPEHAEQLQQIVSYNTSIPTNTPEECNRFSYWVCAMLPIASSLKQPLLEMESGTERLFRVISLLDRVSRTPAGCGLLSLRVVPGKCS